MAGKVVSLRLREEQVQRLQRLARHLGKTPSETGALLIDESLRQADFAHIEFRNSAVGRQAYVKSSSLAVWEVIMVAQGYGMDAERTAAHLAWTVDRVRAAFHYAEAFPNEIQHALDDNRDMGYDALKRLLPGVERITIPARTRALE